MATTGPLVFVTYAELQPLKDHLELLTRHEVGCRSTFNNPRYKCDCRRANPELLPLLARVNTALQYGDIWREPVKNAA